MDSLVIGLHYCLFQWLDYSSTFRSQKLQVYVAQLHVCGWFGIIHKTKIFSSFSLHHLVNSFQPLKENCECYHDSSIWFIVHCQWCNLHVLQASLFLNFEITSGLSFQQTKLTQSMMAIFSFYIFFRSRFLYFFLLSFIWK